MGRTPETHVVPINAKLRLTWALALCAFVLLASTPAWQHSAVNRNGHVVMRGVQVPGLPLGGLSESEAIAAVRSWAERTAQRTLRIYTPDQQWTVTGKQLGWQVDAAAVVADALAVGRRGTLLQRWQTRWHAMFKGVTILPVSASSVRATRTWLGKLEAVTYRPPHNAFRDLETGLVVKEKAGAQLDVEKSVAAIQTALAAQADAVALVVRPMLPRVSYNDVLQVKAPVAIARFSTNFNAAMQNRVANIQMAASMIDGIILQPNEIFSFNDVVGPRLIATGYHDAPELLKGDLVPGVGGGVCQVSSTLYNAVLLSNLQVLQRYKHSAVLGYVQAGRDATVSYGQLDFRFRNTLSFPIVIRTFVTGNRISVGLWGKEALPYQVKLTSESQALPFTTVEQEDTTLPEGRRVVVDEGKPGQLVIIYKEVVQAGQKSGRKSIVSKNLYQPQNRIVKVGVRPQDGVDTLPAAQSGEAPASPVPVL